MHRPLLFVLIVLGLAPGGAATTNTRPGGGEPVVAPCPKLPEFGKSEFLTCVILRDLKDGKERRIAYQSPCT